LNLYIIRKKNTQKMQNLQQADNAAAMQLCITPVYITKNITGIYNNGNTPLTGTGNIYGPGNSSPVMGS